MRKSWSVLLSIFLSLLSVVPAPAVTTAASGMPENRLTTPTMGASNAQLAQVHRREQVELPGFHLAALLSVSKSADPASLPEPGGLVNFTITLLNPLLLGSVQVTKLQDSIYGDVTTPGHNGILSTTCSTPQQVDPLTSYSCSFVAVVTGNANDHHTNKITIYAQDGSSEVVAGEATATVTITDLPSSLAMKKQPHVGQIPESGGVVTYSVWITNTSQVDTIKLTTLNDDRFGNVANTCKQPFPVTLPAHTALFCTFSRTLQGQAGTVHTNVVTASGTDDDGNGVSISSKATVIFLDTPGVLTVTLSATPSSVPEAGGTVTYTVMIRNDSSIDTIAVKSLSDDHFGNVSANCQPALTAQLKVGEVIHCSYARSVQGDFGAVNTNVVTVQGTTDDGQPVNATDKTEVTFLDTPAALVVQKSPNRTTVPVSGAVVTFTVQITNTSPGDAVTVDQLNDSVYGNVTASNPKLIATNCLVPQTLAIHNHYRCQFSSLLSGPIGMVHTNTLTARATDDDNATLQSQGSASVTVIGPFIQATKRDGLLDDRNRDGVASPGDTIGYTVVVANRGNAAGTLIFQDRPDSHTRLLVDQVATTQGVVQTDPLSLTVALGAIAPGGVATITFAVQVVDPLPVAVIKVSNQGLLIGEATPALLTDDPDTPMADDPTETLVVANPRLVAAKRVGISEDADNDGVVSPGDTLSYTIRLANVGNQLAVGLVFSDTLDKVTPLRNNSVTTTQGQVIRGNQAGESAVQVEVGDLAVGATAQIHFQARLVNPLPAGVIQTSNQGLLTGVNIPATVTDDPATASVNDATRTLLSAAPVLQLTKRDLIFTDADGDNTVSAGDTLLYTLRLANVGNTSALDIQITDQPDVHSTLVAGKVQANGGQILTGNAQGDQAVTLAIAELASQHQVDFAFRVLVNSNTVAVLANQASGHYRNPQTATRVEIALVSDDPDTPAANDPTLTPIGGALPAGDQRLFLPTIRR